LSFGKNVKEFFVWNFEFGLLEFICDLVFGACIFYSFMNHEDIKRLEPIYCSPKLQGPLNQSF